MSVTEGRRHDSFPHAMEPGDYGQHRGVWYCVAPNGYAGSLRQHDVTEHEDGTITVSPSILIQRHPEGEWHGYLEQGAWRTV